MWVVVKRCTIVTDVCEGVWGREGVFRSSACRSEIGGQTPATRICAANGRVIVLRTLSRSALAGLAVASSG